MAVVACDLFSHPAPEILNRIEVGTIGRQRDESETKFGGGSLNGLGPMPSGAVLNDHNCARLITQPFSHALQELNRMFFVAVALVPDETLSCAEIVGAIPVDAFCESHTYAKQSCSFRPRCSPSRYRGGCGLHRYRPNGLLATEFFIQLLEAFHKGRTFLWVGFLEYFLTLFPAQPRCLQNPVQRAAGEIAAHDLLEPAPQLFQRSTMTRQSMLYRFCLADNVHELLDLLRAKKGRRPPV